MNAAAAARPLAKHAPASEACAGDSVVCACSAPAHLSTTSPAQSASPTGASTRPPPLRPKSLQCTRHRCPTPLRFFISDADIADGFAETSYQYLDYTQSIQTSMSLNVSAPHFTWGLYFFSKHKLRERCAVGHVSHAFLDFKLGRTVIPSSPPTKKCRWRPRVPCYQCAEGVCPPWVGAGSALWPPRGLEHPRHIDSMALTRLSRDELI